MFDPYLIPNTNILKNKLNILDMDTLEKAEADITYLNQVSEKTYLS